MKNKVSLICRIVLWSLSCVIRVKKKEDKKTNWDKKYTWNRLKNCPSFLRKIPTYISSIKSIVKLLKPKDKGKFLKTEKWYMAYRGKKHASGRSFMRNNVGQKIMEYHHWHNGKGALSTRIYIHWKYPYILKENVKTFFR